MILDNVNYVNMTDEVTCSMSACLSMLLTYYGENISPINVTDLFYTTFLSSDFREWNNSCFDIDRKNISEMMACAEFTINNRFMNYIANVITTDINKIPLSYIKRGIPIILTGNFPLSRGNVSNSIFIKGYVDNFLIVNDPRGNARSGYKDRFGESMLYEMKEIEKWIGGPKIHILRLLDK